MRNGVIVGKTARAPGWRIDLSDNQLTSGSSCLSKLARGEICRKDEGKGFILFSQCASASLELSTESLKIYMYVHRAPRQEVAQSRKTKQQLSWWTDGALPWLLLSTVSLHFPFDYMSTCPVDIRQWRLEATRASMAACSACNVWEGLPDVKWSSAGQQAAMPDQVALLFMKDNVVWTQTLWRPYHSKQKTYHSVTEPPRIVFQIKAFDWFNWIQYMGVVWGCWVKLINLRDSRAVRTVPLLLFIFTCGEAEQVYKSFFSVFRPKVMDAILIFCPRSSGCYLNLL